MRLRIVLALFFCAISAHALAADAARPNIVLIVSDDHAWNDYGFMGHAHVQTPRLDKLAAESVTFKRGYVTSSLCCPSLVTILTGRYPHEHKITSNDPPMPQAAKKGERYKDPLYLERREQMNALIDSIPTIPKVLAQRGYISLQTGKWWQGNFKRGGFTHGMSDGDPIKGGRHGDAGLAIGRKTMQPIYDFIDTARKDEKPFFVWYAPMMPHDPHTPPDRLLEKYRDKAPSLHVARYWAMIEWFDETCGQLLDHLEKQGLAENTIVAYVADNGWIQNLDTPRFAPRSKLSQYDGGLRTPIMIRWPGKAKPQMSAHLASSIDLAPTLLKAAGAELPAGLPGLDLLDESAVKARDTIYGTCCSHDAVDIHTPAKNVYWRWCLSGDWKLIVPNPELKPDAPVELYNVASDPLENRNLAEEDTARVSALQKKLDAWWPGK